MSRRDDDSPERVPGTITSDVASPDETGTLRPLFVLLLVALLLRIVAAWSVEQHVQSAGRRFFVEGDANGYWDLGHAIAEGRDYSIYSPPRRVLRTPGFPLLLAGSIRLFGDHVLPARLILAVVGTACCWLTWLLGTQLFNHRTGLWAAGMMAVNPFQVGNSVLILSENWFTFWMLAAFISLAALLRNNESTPRIAWSAIFSGCLLALSVLVRPGFILWLVPTLGAVLLLARCSPATRLTAAVLLFAAFSATMFPWAYRNHTVTGHWVATSLWSGPSLYDGLNPQADGTSNMMFFDEENVMSQMSEFEMNAHYQHRAFDFAIKNPGPATLLAIRKMRRFLQPFPQTVPAGWAAWATFTAGYAVFTALCLAGLWRIGQRWVEVLICTGPFLLFLAVHMVFVGSLRYRLPAEFPLAILAAIGLQRWMRAPVAKR